MDCMAAVAPFRPNTTNASVLHSLQINFKPTPTKHDTSMFIYASICFNKASPHHANRRDTESSLHVSRRMRPGGSHHCHISVFPEKVSTQWQGEDDTTGTGSRYKVAEEKMHHIFKCEQREQTQEKKVFQKPPWTGT